MHTIVKVKFFDVPPRTPRTQREERILNLTLLVYKIIFHSISALFQQKIFTPTYLTSATPTNQHHKQVHAWETSLLLPETAYLEMQ
jgi:hypothetical protein